MSTYKVIQDIEAEDHILGPLSLRQFIYGLIAAFFLYLCFICLTKGLAFMLVVFLPPALFCVFFAFPFGKDQPTEVWALAKIRFLFKPRKRIWNQSGVKELVTVTVPKKIEVQLTDGLSQNEVKSRLQALADTIDSRGWVIKNVATNTYVRPGLLGQNDSGERLLSIANAPQSVPEYDERDGNDLLDDQVSPLAQQFGAMIQTSAQNHRKQLLDNLAQERVAVQQQSVPQWFAQPATAAPQPVAQQPQTSDQAISRQISNNLAAQAQANARLHTLAVPSDNPVSQPPAAPVAQPQTPVTRPPDPAILNLAKRNDLNVSTLAREASKAKGLDDGEEVVISLH